MTLRPLSLITCLIAGAYIIIFNWWLLFNLCVLRSALQIMFFPRLCSSRLVFSERSILRLSQQQLSSSRHFPTCCHCHHSRGPDLRQPGLRLLPPSTSTSSTTSVPIPPLHPVFSLIAQPCRLSHSETLHQPAVAVLLMVRLAAAVRRDLNCAVLQSLPRRGDTYCL